MTKPSNDDHSGWFMAGFTRRQWYAIHGLLEKRKTELMDDGAEAYESNDKKKLESHQNAVKELNEVIDKIELGLNNKQGV